MFRLANTKRLPRDGFTYTDPSGRSFGGMYSFGYVVNQILAYRLGNSLPRATKLEVTEDLDAFTCLKDPSLCYDSTVRIKDTVRTTTRCGGCGVRAR